MTEPVPTFKITCRRFLLAALLDKASNVIPTKEVIKVLRNFQVEAKDNRLRIAASDLELSIICTTSMVKVDTPGRIVLPAKKMQEICRNASGEDVSIEVVDGTATVLCGRTSWTLKLDLDGDTYPPLPEDADVTLYEIDRGRLLGGLGSVRYAADASRPNMAMIDFTDGKFTATDGSRFQQAQLGEDFPLSIQIPIAAVDDLIKILRGMDMKDIQIGESENHLVFRTGTDTFIVNKLMSSFPDIESKFLGPAANNTDELHIGREELLAAIRRVRINADTDSSAVLLRLHSDTISLVAQDKGGNASTEDLAAGWKYPPRDVVVNHKFLTDMLNMYDGLVCKFYLGAATKTKKPPLMLRDEVTGLIGLVQEMRADFVMDLE